MSTDANVEQNTANMLKEFRDSFFTLFNEKVEQINKRLDISDEKFTQRCDNNEQQITILQELILEKRNSRKNSLDALQIQTIRESATRMMDDNDNTNSNTNTNTNDNSNADTQSNTTNDNSNN